MPLEREAETSGNSNGAGNPGDVRQRFRQLAKTWRRETSHLSVMAQKAEHPAFREIVSLGQAVVPWLLAELQRQPGPWFLALHEITRADPIPAGSDGDVAAMSRAWVDWGKAEGHIR
jgi:hypothetical protein